MRIIDHKDGDPRNNELSNLRVASWHKLYEDLEYGKAMLRARSIQDSERKLRALGYKGNYADVAIRLCFEGPHGKKFYAVWVLPL